MNKKIISYLIMLLCSSSYAQAASSEEFTTSLPALAALEELSQKQSLKKRRGKNHQPTEEEPFRGRAGNYQCITCSYTCQRMSHIRVHCTMHINARNYPCTEESCEKSFNRQDSLTRHMQEMHAKIKFFPCSVCKRTFVRKEHLDLHTKSYKGKEHPPFNSREKIKKFSKKRPNRSISFQEKEDDDDDDVSTFSTRQSVRLACRKLAGKVRSFKEIAESSEEDEEDEEEEEEDMEEAESSTERLKDTSPSNSNHSNAGKLESFNPDNMEAFELHPIFIQIARDYPLNPGSVNLTQFDELLARLS